MKSKWTPQATIRAYDDIVGGFIPLQGVKVRIRYFAFLHAYHYTDAYGHVSFSKKRTKVEYSIEWERDKWDIRDNHVQAYYNGPHKKSSWDLYIGTWTPKSLHYSAIHRALYKYYYGNTLGVTKPSHSLKISYKTGSDPDGHANASTDPKIVRTWYWWLSAIKVYQKSPSGAEPRKVSEVLATTIHELTHASLDCRLTKSQYEKTSSLVKESWSVFVEWIFMRDIYSNYTKLIDNRYKAEDWLTVNRSKAYSPLFIDMVDKENQYQESGSDPYDELSGYTIYSINAAIPGFRKLNDIEKFMKQNKPKGVTDELIDKYLETYKKYKL